MTFEVLFLGKTRSSYLAAGIDDFSRRLKRYCRLRVKVLRPKRSSGDPARVLAAEGAQLLAARSPGFTLVALDPAGRQYSSEELASLLGKWEHAGRKCMTFAIGGELGLDAAVLAESALVLSLSRLTFTHEMSRLLLLEQLYRAATIRAGEKYHK